MTNQHITKEYLASFKSRDLISLECEECGSSFTQSKNQIQGHMTKYINFFCSKTCSGKHNARNKKEGNLIKCQVCSKVVYKQKHDVASGKSLFCSRRCANTIRVMTEETKEKIRIKNKSWIKNLKENEPLKYMEYCEKQREGSLKSNKDRSKKIKALYDAKPWEKLGKDAKRRRVFDEQNYKCTRCGLFEWHEKPITLELEHKDGNHMNDERDNLEALCPNCHSLTDTWRGKNKRLNKHIKISDAVLLESLKATDTIRQALIFVGLSPRGGNYVRAKRLLQTILPK